MLRTLHNSAHFEVPGVGSDHVAGDALRGSIPLRATKQASALMGGFLLGLAKELPAAQSELGSLLAW